MRVARQAALVVVFCLIVAPLVSFAFCPVFHSTDNAHSCCPRHQPVKDCSVSCIDFSSHQAVGKGSVDGDPAVVDIAGFLDECGVALAAPEPFAPLLADSERYLRNCVIRR
jgi:hypothetical protein